MGSQKFEKFDGIEANKHNYKIRIISSKISIDRFYSNIEPASVIKDLIKISSPQDNEITIFIWPEGILPEISKDQLQEYKWLFENKFNEKHILAIGINAVIKQDQVKKYFNTFSIYDHNLEKIDTYNKIKISVIKNIASVNYFITNKR